MTDYLLVCSEFKDKNEWYEIMTKIEAVEARNKIWNKYEMGARR